MTDPINPPESEKVTAPNCVMVWLTEGEMEWLQYHGNVRLYTDVVKTESGHLRVVKHG